VADEHQQPVRPEDIIGTWRLIAYTAQDDAGVELHHPLGSDADGFLMYTSDGYMSVQMMRRVRIDYDTPDVSGGSTEQFAAAAAGYVAYCGPFDIDPATGTVRHLVTVSLLPNWLRTVQIRRPVLQADHLAMHATYAVGPATVTSILRWNRADRHDPLLPVQR
jgi:Lipocalin-like domain